MRCPMRFHQLEKTIGHFRTLRKRGHGPDWDSQILCNSVLINDEVGILAVGDHRCSNLLGFWNSGAKGHTEESRKKHEKQRHHTKAWVARVGLQFSWDEWRWKVLVLDREGRFSVQLYIGNKTMGSFMGEVLLRSGLKLVSINWKSMQERSYRICLRPSASLFGGRGNIDAIKRPERSACCWSSCTSSRKMRVTMTLIIRKH